MMDCILWSDRRSQLKEKLINAFEGYEHLTKMQKMTYMLSLSHNVIGTHSLHMLDAHSC